MNTLTNNIIEFFKEINNKFNHKITSVEVQPIQIKKNVYVTGLQRVGLTQINVHVKHIKKITIKTNLNEFEQVLQDNPQEEMFIDCELMNEAIIKEAFFKLKNYLVTLENLEIVNVQYKLKDEQDNCALQEETIIFDDRHAAYKHIIKLRKQSSMFKSKFINCGNKNENNTISDEDFADMKLI